MTDYLPPIDAVALAVAALTAGSTGPQVGAGRIAGRLPRGFEHGQRAVRVTRVGGTPTDHTGHLDRARLQVECYAETDSEAYALGQTALVDLMALRGQAVPGGVVTDVRQDTGLRDFPDPSTKAPRSVLGVVLYAHPVAP